MFDNPRYITSGVQETIPTELQIFLWQLIDDLKTQGQKLDYLQVFEVTSTLGKNEAWQVQVKHRQEQPPCSSTHQLQLQMEEPVFERLFCICDGTHSTLLLASEY